MLHALHRSKIRGVQLAIVVDNTQGEGNPGYRVKVKFPWLSEQETSFWARIAVPMAGCDRGTYVLPEIDDQVLVVFEHGDINRPIVVGSLWSRKQEPVEVHRSGKNNTKLIKSRTGHRIIFDDQHGAERIVIVDRTSKNKIVLDSANKLVKIESDGDIEVAAHGNVIMHARALKVGTSQAVTGKGRSMLVHSQKTFGLKATSGITIGGGNTTINVSSSAATSVSGAGAGELGGGATEDAPGPKTDGRAGDATGAGAASPASPKQNTIAAPREASGATPPATAVGESEPLPPVVFAARWEKACTRFRTTIKLIAGCSNAAGRPATFTIQPVGGGRSLATLTASCGDSCVETQWTTHEGPAPDRLVFEVAVADQHAQSGELAFLVPVEGSVRLSGAPAANLKLRLIASDGTELRGQTDVHGAFRIEDVPSGRFQLAPDEDLLGGG